MKALAYMNFRCSNCRGLKEILEEKGIEAEYKEYLSEPLTESEILELAKLCKLSVHEMMRTKEDAYAAYKGKELSDSEWAKIIVKTPVLLQRPIFIYGKKAIIARPPEKALEIL